jgi:hypothetical protein
MAMPSCAKWPRREPVVAGPCRARRRCAVRRRAASHSRCSSWTGEPRTWWALASAGPVQPQLAGHEAPERLHQGDRGCHPAGWRDRRGRVCGPAAAVPAATGVAVRWRDPGQAHRAGDQPAQAPKRRPDYPAAGPGRRGTAAGRLLHLAATQRHPRGADHRALYPSDRPARPRPAGRAARRDLWVGGRRAACYRPPGSYPDRTCTGWRTRAYAWVLPSSPPLPTQRPTLLGTRT